MGRTETPSTLLHSRDLPRMCPSPQAEVEEFLFPEPRLLLDRLSASTGPRFAALNVAIGQMLEEFSLVSFVPLDVTDEERCVRSARTCVFCVCVGGLVCFTPFLIHALFV